MFQQIKVEFLVSKIGQILIFMMIDVAKCNEKWYTVVFIQTLPFWAYLKEFRPSSYGTVSIRLRNPIVIVGKSSGHISHHHTIQIRKTFFFFITGMEAFPIMSIKNLLYIGELIVVFGLQCWKVVMLSNIMLQFFVISSGRSLLIDIFLNHQSTCTNWTLDTHEFK